MRRKVPFFGKNVSVERITRSSLKQNCLANCFSKLLLQYIQLVVAWLDFSYLEWHELADTPLYELTESFVISLARVNTE
jgi:hypothetical protein